MSPDGKPAGDCPCGDPDCTRPPCSGCYEGHASIIGTSLCRDCDIESRGTRMTCQTCGYWRMSDFGKELFNTEGCVCAEFKPTPWVSDRERWPR
jgi:hypothetical protein